MSHPTWVRGLKYYVAFRYSRPKSVAPHVGAWIEIYTVSHKKSHVTVAPHVGAWIEIIPAR